MLRGSPSVLVGCVREAGQVLVKLAIRDDALIRRAMVDEEHGRSPHCPLDSKAHALVRIGGLIAVDAAAASYLPAVEEARSAGATDEELVACLFALLPVVGVARVVSAAPKLGLALGYDVEDALEGSDVALG
jgi:alkylhydroperoxidase/carboxymuconolactone decarboxylase family protein YurZ